LPQCGTDGLGLPPLRGYELTTTNEDAREIHMIEKARSQISAIAQERGQNSESRFSTKLTDRYVVRASISAAALAFSIVSAALRT
jgi:hypothetical protein